MNKMVWRIYIQSKTTDFAEKSQMFVDQDAAMRARSDMERAFPNLDVSIIGQIENDVEQSEITCQKIIENIRYGGSGVSLESTIESIKAVLENNGYVARFIKADEWEANYRKKQGFGHNIDECNDCKIIINDERYKILTTAI